MYFIVKSCIRICPLITVHYRIPQKSVKTYKFHGNGQILRLGSKFCIVRKTVVPSDLAVIMLTQTPSLPHADQLKLTFFVYTVSQKKTSHFNFWHNFAICWDIFTIFETPCSGLIAGWCNLLHTHHQCEAFTSHDVTHDVIQAAARSVHWHRISYHLTYGVWTHRT